MIRRGTVRLIENLVILVSAALGALDVYGYVTGPLPPRLASEAVMATFILVWVLKVRRARWAREGANVLFWIPVFGLLAWAFVRTLGTTPVGIGASAALLALHAAIVWYVVRRWGGGSAAPGAGHRPS